MCEFYSNMKAVSMYCDWIDSECFRWGMCDNCKYKINAAAFDMLDDYHFSSAEFLQTSGSGWIFTPDEFQQVYERMVEIENERAAAPCVDIPL